MLQKIKDYINKWNMLEKGDTVVLGVSGGADSVCLLSVIAAIKDDYQLDIEVVHINHLIRFEAKEEAAYVEELCKTFHINYHLVEKDVQKLASDLKITVEEAGRQVRYNAFETILDGRKGKIAVAHNQNDRAETLLFHLFRGTGIKGMGSIPPIRDNIIRPLLCIERKEIEEYLRRENLSFCIDQSNLENAYTRNRIRNEILPIAMQYISPSAVEHLAGAASMASEAEEYIQLKMQEAWKEVVIEEFNDNLERIKIYFNREAFCKEESIIQKYIIRESIERLVRSKKDITAVHIQDILSLFTKQVGKTIMLPYELEAATDYKSVILAKRQIISLTEEKTNYSEEITVPMTKRLEDETLITFAFEDNFTSECFIEKTYTKWFDYDKIDKSLLLRTRQSGDFLVINDKNQKQSLKSYYINQKIPKLERDKQLVLADGNHILWIVGYRTSSYYHVTEQTKRILRVTIGKEENPTEERKSKDG